MPPSQDPTTKYCKAVLAGKMSWQIERPDTQSKFQALAIGDAISGPKPATVLVDEVREFKSERPIER
jgi:hypothetical protein